MSVVKSYPIIHVFLEIGLRKIPLERPVSVLGNDASCCDIVLDDPGLSPRHAFIVRKQDAFHLYDFRSHSGTWVNSAAVGKHHRLRPHDIIQIGQQLLEFRVETEHAPAESEILSSLSRAGSDRIASPDLPTARNGTDEGWIAIGAAIQEVLPVLYRSCGQGTFSPADRERLLAFCDLASGTLERIAETA